MFSEDAVCRQCGLAPYILRYWQLHFPELRGEAQGYKTTFSANDIALVWRIKKLLYIDRLSMDEAKKRLRAEQSFPVCDPGRAGLGPRIASTQTMRVELSETEEKKAKSFADREKEEEKQRLEAKRLERIERVRRVISELKELKSQLS